MPLFALCILSMSMHCIYHLYAGGIQVNVAFGLDILPCVEWLKNAIRYHWKQTFHPWSFVVCELGVRMVLGVTKVDLGVHVGFLVHNQILSFAFCRYLFCRVLFYRYFSLFFSCKDKHPCRN